VTVSEATSPADIDAFIRFPAAHYGRDENFVPPIIVERREFLDRTKNPYFRQARAAYFLARRRGEVVGRIAAVNDSRYNQFHGTMVAFFGMFESQNDTGLAAALFKAAAEWARREGLRTMMGPLNFCFHHEAGLLIDGFDSPASMWMPYNPPYYESLYDANGLKKLKDMFTYELLASQPLPEKVVRFAERARTQGGVRVRRIDPRDAFGEMRRIKAIYDSMIKPGFGFSPIAEAEWEGMVDRLRPLISLRPELALIAEVGGTPAAFSITTPEMKEPLKAADGHLSRFGLPVGLAKLLWATRKVDRLRMLLFGIQPGYRRRGIDAVLAHETYREALRLGYESCEIGWVQEDQNLILRTITAVGARRIKSYRIYERGI
jgi:GNAT superfamily N-acetyltransferase